MSRYMKAAWQITYLVEGYDADGQLASWRWKGHAKTDRYELSEPSEDAPGIAVGTVSVTSWQPYRSDAIADANRAVLDLCVVVGAAIGGLSLTPVKPPLSIKELDGAKSQGGLTLTDSASFALTQNLDGKDTWLKAVDRLDEKPILRADLDTLLIAKNESDLAARTLNLYRIYDRYITTWMASQPQMFNDGGDRQAIAKAAVAALPDLGAEERARLKQTLENAVARIRSKPRVEIILSNVTAVDALKDISKETLQKIENHRGRIAHNPTIADDSALDPNVTSALFQIVWTLLKKELGLQT